MGADVVKASNLAVLAAREDHEAKGLKGAGYHALWAA
jgi:hypothetical protein